MPLKDKNVFLHFFLGSADWYICEFDGEDLFFGFCILNDLTNAEWGYVSFDELRSIKVSGWLEVDCELEEFWKVKRAIEIEKIRVAHGWSKENNSQHTVSNEDELIMKVQAGHFQQFQDLFAEVTSPHSDYFGIDPYRIWEAANGYKTD